jgi:hypothetical protein
VLLQARRATNVANAPHKVLKDTPRAGINCDAFGVSCFRAAAFSLDPSAAKVLTYRKFTANSVVPPEDCAFVLFAPVAPRPAVELQEVKCLPLGVDSKVAAVAEEELVLHEAVRRVGRVRCGAAARVLSAATSANSPSGT